MQTKTKELLLDRYKIISKLGKGGFSDVYRAFDTRMERVVAIKQVDLGRHTAEQVLREARTVALLNHPNIVTIHEFEEEDDKCYLIMELLDGLPLSRILSKISPLTEEEAIVIASEVCKALDVAHGRGIVHRDIKPSNIMVLFDGRIKVMDFGIAHLKGAANTAGGNIIGTFAYMSPEQARGGIVDERSDIYSLATMLYEMLTDCIPLSGESMAETLKMIQTVDPHPPSMLNPELNQKTDSCVLKALSKNPRARYQSAELFSKALNNLHPEVLYPEEVLEGLIERYAEYDDEIDLEEELDWRGRLWRGIEERSPAIARATIAILLSYPFFNMPSKVFGILSGFSFIIAIFIYFMVLLRPDLGIGLALSLQSIVLIKYSVGLFLVVVPLLIPFWMFAARRWPLLSITPISGALFGILRIPFVLPILAGLLAEPVVAAVVSGAGCVVFETMNIFLSQSTGSGVANAYGVWEQIKGVSNPIVVGSKIIVPFFSNPVLLLQPVLWALASATTAILRGKNRWFLATVGGLTVLIMGYQALASNLTKPSIQMADLMQGISFSLIILLLLSVFRPPATSHSEDEDDGDTESEELTTTTEYIM
jgi:serine/threonine-protein kinase